MPLQDPVWYPTACLLRKDSALPRVHLERLGPGINDGATRVSGANDDRCKPGRHLRSSFELVNVCQGWEQSVLNRTFCVGNVAQTPQAATSGLRPRRCDSAGAAMGKRPQGHGANLPPVIRRPQVVGIVPPSII